MIKDTEPNVLDAVKSLDPGGVCQGSCDLLFKFWDPLHNFRSEEARHFVFLC